MISQNATFSGDVPQDYEFEHPPGAWLARYLAKEISAAGWQPSEIDNWRDCGWSVVYSLKAAKLELTVAAMGSDGWALQVSAFDRPGMLRRFFGAKSSATESDIFSLANVAHDVLEKSSCFTDIRWLADGLPDEKNSLPRPRNE